jgi:hypothetical protein
MFLWNNSLMADKPYAATLQEAQDIHRRARARIFEGGKKQMQSLCLLLAPSGMSPTMLQRCAEHLREALKDYERLRIKLANYEYAIALEEMQAESIAPTSDQAPALASAGRSRSRLRRP